MSSHYYYDQIGKVQQQVYHVMLKCLQAIEPSCIVSKIDTREIADIFFTLRLDHPEIFYVSGFSYRYYQGADSLELIPEYMFRKKQIQEHQKAMESRVSKLVRQVDGKDEKTKEQYVHDFICQNVHYDKLKKSYSHEIIGPLGQGVGVCEGIAKSVKILLDRLGIWNIIVISEANPEKGIRYRHAWNMVRIGGKTFHLDATFDNSLGQDGEIRHDYFNIGDTQVFRDHEPSIWRVPECTDNTHSYYIEKKVALTKYEDVEKRIAQNAKKGKNFIFQWRGSYLTKQVLSELFKIITEQSRSKGKSASVSVNFPQAVFRISFSEEQMQDEVILQEANEGEQEIVEDNHTPEP